MRLVGKRKEINMMMLRKGRRDWSYERKRARRRCRWWRSLLSFLSFFRLVSWRGEMFWSVLRYCVCACGTVLKNKLDEIRWDSFAFAFLKIVLISSFFFCFAACLIPLSLASPLLITSLSVFDTWALPDLPLSASPLTLLFPPTLLRFCFDVRNYIGRRQWCIYPFLSFSLPIPPACTYSINGGERISLSFSLSLVFWFWWASSVWSGAHEGSIYERIDGEAETTTSFCPRWKLRASVGQHFSPSSYCWWFVCSEW